MIAYGLYFNPNASALIFVIAYSHNIYRIFFNLTLHNNILSTRRRDKVIDCFL